MVNNIQRKSKKQRKPRGPELRVASWFLSLFFIVLIPLIFANSTLDPVYFPRFVAMAAGIMIFTLLFYPVLKNKKIDFQFLKSGFFYVLVGFVLMSALSLIFALNPAESLADIFKWFMASLLIVYTTAILINNENAINLIFKAVVVTALIAVIIGIYQYLSFSFNNDDPEAIYEVKGLMAHKNQYAISLFLLLPFLASGITRLSKTWIRPAWIALIAAFLMILFLQTRSVWTSLFVCAIFSAICYTVVFRDHPVLASYRKKFKKIAIGAGLFLVLGIAVFIIIPEGSPLSGIKHRITSIFDLGQTSNSWRLEMWSATVDMIEDHPLTGTGAGNWILHIYPYYSKYLPSVFRQWRHAHNDYLETAAEKGIFGLILYVLLFVFLLIRGVGALSKIKSGRDWWTVFWMMNGLVGFMAISFFSFPAGRINQVIFLSLIAALVVSLSSEKQEHPEKSLRIPHWIVAFPLIIAGFALYYGIIAIRSEYYVNKVQTAKDHGNWRQVKKYINEGYHPLAPIEPKYSLPTILYKGMAYYHVDHDFHKALVYFKQAYKQHPSSVPVFNNIGSAYGQMGIYDSSLVWYHKSLDIFPHYEYALLNMAKACYLNGEYKKAYLYVLSLDPQSENKEVTMLRKKIEELLDE